MARKRKTDGKRRQGKSYVEYLREYRSQQARSCRKTVFFSRREVEMIDRYCEKYKIRSRSAFFRELILSHLFRDLDENYPRLF